MNLILSREQYKIHHYLMVGFLLFYPLLFPCLFLRCQITRFCLVFFWSKTKFSIHQWRNIVPGYLQLFIFHFISQCFYFFIFFFNLSLGCRGTCFINLTLPLPCFIALASLSLGWSGTRFIKTALSSLFFLLFFVCVKCPFLFKFL